ncbi:upstream-binding protein 1-like [Stegodyphus dumicola]|uniref:upstream-binding protein 1-like n=1 Tax=Stegodyphus dumicola TaxID=202533 RepID=UPI0015A7716D|nr:upstream-binding protein 1-like [Stegodyphus dumicola]
MKGLERVKLCQKNKFTGRDLQPSYQCTVFTPSTIKVENIPFQDFSESLSPQSFNSSIDVKPESPVISASEVTTSTPSVTSSPQNGPEQKDKSEMDESGIVIQQAQGDEIYITAKTSTAELHNWLIKNKFSKYLSCFALYSAKDLLCLSRADMVDICGAADGIRLYNCLHIRHPPPLRKFYISKDRLRFHGLYLDSLTCYEVKEQLCKIYRLPSGTVGEIYVTGPEGILLIITDKVLQNMKDESTYISDVLKAEENENYTIILKSYKNIPNQET